MFRVFPPSGQLKCQFYTISSSTPGIRTNGIGVGTMNAGVDKKNNKQGRYMSETFFS